MNQIKEYYVKVEKIDYVEIFDHHRGVESIFVWVREKSLRKLIEKHKGTGPLLDVGCGTGVILRKLPRGTTGLDINPWNIKRARTYVPTANLVVGDAENLPFRDCVFSTIVCSEVLEHLGSPCASVEEIHRILKDGGTLIGSVPHFSFIWKLVESGHYKLSKEQYRLILSRIHLLSSTLSYEAPIHKLYRQEEIDELLLPSFDVLKNDLGFLKLNVFFVAQKRESSNREG